jgi:hypothetical protein
MAFLPIKPNKIGYHSQPIRGFQPLGNGGPGPVPPGGCDILAGLQAARPAPSTDCRVYLPTDGHYLYRDNGVSWVPWGPLFPCVVPPTAGWSWDNQGTATISHNKDVIYLYCPTVGWDNARIRYRTAPTAPYSFTAFMVLNTVELGHGGGFLVFRDSGTNNIVSFGLWHTGTGANLIKVDKWTNSTTWLATYTSLAWSQTEPIWFKATDNNTNFIFYYSKDGQNWIQFYTVSRTDFLTTPDQIGFGGLSCDTNEDTSVTIMSWEEL